MSKKLMLLAAGALSALAFAALPAVGSAVETEVHCATTPCNGTIKGLASEHAIELENDKGERISADEVTGTLSIAQATTTTGTSQLKFINVHETISGFKFTCNSPGQPAGVITTNVMTGHFINLTTGGTNPAVLMTGANVTFTCAAFLTRTVTGNIIGTVTAPHCNAASTTHQVTFNIKPGTAGTQEHELWTGKSFDLTSGPHASDETTSAQTGKGTITWNNPVTLTC